MKLVLTFETTGDTTPEEDAEVPTAREQRWLRAMLLMSLDALWGAHLMVSNARGAEPMGEPRFKELMIQEALLPTLRSVFAGTKVSVGVEFVGEVIDPPS